MTQASEWKGRVGDVWAEEWRRTDRALGPLNDALVAAIAARAGARPAILDIGCGAGTTSLALAERIAGADVTGIDLSRSLIAVARARAKRRPGLRFEVADAARWSPAAGRFDAIVSRHGVMFFDDPAAAFGHLRTLAAAEAHLVFSCFRDRAGNQWASALDPVFERFAPGMPAAPPSAPGPFAFADPARVAHILASAGFAAPLIAPFDFDFVTGIGADPVADSVAFFRRIGPFAALLKTLDKPAARAAIDQVGAIAASHLDGDHVIFRAAAWIVSTRPAPGKSA